MVHIIVEGNIGVGKTTLLETMRELYGSKVRVFSEPIKKWQCYHGDNLLSAMYNDPKRWSFTFQKAISLSLIKMHDEASKIQDAHVISERSIFGAKQIFVEHLKNKGFLSKVEYGILEEDFNFLISSWKLAPEIIVYMRASPEVCYKRIQDRGRVEEKKITLDYLKGLHELHERWLSPSCNHCHNDIIASKSTIVIDANQPKEKIIAQLRANENRLFGV
ncbi:deoxynucleoside kinase-like [Panonychus citri]|uniref:deoxynucleoside kinase-like n=1 Tax=Panonychus citri TaxID=50023 RepID=UPI0023073AE8|nr:deoxynucleoside kinase-like [Panonychus citri]